MGADEVRDHEPTLIELAFAAARRGDLDGVDRHLAELRTATHDDLEDLADELHRLVACVRAHPSYDPSQAAREAS